MLKSHFMLHLEEYKKKSLLVGTHVGFGCFLNVHVLHCYSGNLKLYCGHFRLKTRFKYLSIFIFELCDKSRSF